MRLLAKGHSKTEIVRLIGRSRHSVDNVVAREMRRVPAPPKVWDPSSARLSMSEREETRGGLERGESFTAIAVLPTSSDEQASDTVQLGQMPGCVACTGSFTGIAWATG